MLDAKRESSNCCLYFQRSMESSGVQAAFEKRAYVVIMIVSPSNRLIACSISNGSDAPLCVSWKRRPASSLTSCSHHPLAFKLPCVHLII